jgi:hypothetical protein
VTQLLGERRARLLLHPPPSPPTAERFTILSPSLGVMTPSPGPNGEEVVEDGVDLMATTQEWRQPPPLSNGEERIFWHLYYRLPVSYFLA